MKYSIILLAVLIFTQTAHSQEMITDRPDFTESAIAVPKKSVQIELGVTMQRSNNLDEWLYPNTLARIGLLENFELRLGLPGWSSQSVGAMQQTFFQDMLMEGKVQLTSTAATVPMAVIFAATIPNGDKAVSTGKSDFGIKYVAAYDFSERMGLGANVGVFSIGESRERVMSGLASVSVGLTLTDRLGSFLELYSEMPGNSTWTPTFDGGFTWLITPLFQLDATFGLGLNEAAMDQFFGLGASVRL